MDFREEEDSQSGLRFDTELIVTPQTNSPEEVVDALNNIDNYGIYKSNLINSKRGLKQSLEDYFQTTIEDSTIQYKNLSHKNSLLRKGYTFPIKTKQSIDNFISGKSSTPKILKFEIKGNGVIFPKDGNPSRDTLGKIIAQVLGTAGITYTVKETTSSDTQFESKTFKKSELKNIIKEEIKKIK